MSNLLEETRNDLEEHGKTFEDVCWIGSPDFEIPKEQFMELANVEYDSGFGAQEVARDLLVVGADFWLERYEYDGSEWWEFKDSQTRSTELRVVKTLFPGMWENLIEQFEEDE